MNATANNLEILQIVQVTDFEKIPSPVVFDQYGKIASYKYFQQVLKTLKDHQYIYYPGFHFRQDESYQYEERFLKIQNNLLIKVASFEECQFYECLFSTCHMDGHDMGIVSFFDYTTLNGAQIIKVHN